MEAIEIVRKVVALYDKIKHQVPDKIVKIGKRMCRLEAYLLSLEELISDKSRHVLAQLRPAESVELRIIIKEIRDDSQSVYELLEKWDKNIGPFGWQMRFTSVSQAYFSISSSPEKLDSLTKDIETNKQDLKDFLQLIAHYGLNQLLAPSAPNSVARSPSPAPLAAQGKKFNLIFIDPHNLGRSVVAEAYMALLGEWTVRSGGFWPIDKAHSAGIRVQNKSDIVDTLQNLKPPIQMGPGNWLPLEMAMASLFDNSTFDWPYKKRIKTTFEEKVCSYQPLLSPPSNAQS